MRSSYFELFKLFGASFSIILKGVRSTIETHDITGPQFGAMRILSDFGPMMPSELSDKMFVTPGNMTGVVNRLIKLGYIERRRRKSDRRSIRLSLTRTGAKKVDEVMPSVVASLGRSFSVLNISEQDELFRVLGDFSKRLKETCNSPACEVVKK